VKPFCSFRGRGSPPVGDGSEAGPPSHMRPARRGSPQATGRAGTPRPPGGRGGAEATCRGSAVALRRHESPAVLDMDDGKEAEP